MSSTSRYHSLRSPSIVFTATEGIMLTSDSVEIHGAGGVAVAGETTVTGNITVREQAFLGGNLSDPTGVIPLTLTNAYATKNDSVGNPVGVEFRMVTGRSDGEYPGLLTGGRIEVGDAIDGNPDSIASTMRFCLCTGSSAVTESYGLEARMGLRYDALDVTVGARMWAGLSATGGATVAGGLNITGGATVGGDILVTGGITMLGSSIPVGDGSGYMERIKVINGTSNPYTISSADMGAILLCRKNTGQFTFILPSTTSDFCTAGGSVVGRVTIVDGNGMSGGGVGNIVAMSTAGPDMRINGTTMMTIITSAYGGVKIVNDAGTNWYALRY